MNVSVENIGPCKRLLRVEADVNEVEKAFEEITRDFLKHATLPGFRPGKAPKEMVLRRFEKEIQEETQSKLVRDLYRAAVEQQKLKVFRLEDVEPAPCTRGQPMQFTATVELEPEFELPSYRQIPVTVQVQPVTEEDVDRALEALRRQRTSYQTVQRPLTEADVVVVHATGTYEGQPLSQKLGAGAAPYDSVRDFWMNAERELGPQAFAQLIGAQSGEKRTVQVTYPQDFSIKEMAGKTVTYEVEVVSVREKVVPALDDELAKAYDAANLAALREGVRRDLENEAKYQRRNQILNQIARHLLTSATFDVPESAWQMQTRQEVYDEVAYLQQRGLSPEQIEQHKESIYTQSRGQALSRLKLQFILDRIAEAEKIQVTNEELAQHLTLLAYQRQANPATFLKEVQKSGEINVIVHRLLHDKVMDFLAQQAQVTEQQAPPPPAEPAGKDQPAS